jgi:hypothetical protein
LRKFLEGFVVIAFLSLVGFALAAKTYGPPRWHRALDVSIAKQDTLLYEVAYPRFFKFPDGTLVVNDVVSEDGGKTWKTATPLPVDGAGGSIARLADGSVLALGFLTEKVGDGKFRGARWVSTDSGRTWQGPLDAIFYIPKAAGGTDDRGAKHTGPWVHRSIVELPDGDLIASMYGYFVGDTVPIPTFPREWNIYKYRTYKYRTFVVRSTDGGATWKYLSTVAYDPTIGNESFCEPSLQLLPNHQILCVMRTGAELYQCRSSNWGQTWSRPESLGVPGVDPQLCLMENGVLACAYGRPGASIIFDETATGRGWGQPTCVYDRPTSGYSCLEEIAPGVLLYVYDAQGVVEEEGSAPVNCARGAFITVVRK